MSADEINMECATLMGWYDFGSTAPERGSLKPRIIGRNMERMDRRRIPDFHGSMDAAWQLVEFARKMGCEFTICSLPFAIRCQFIRSLPRPAIGKDFYTGDADTASAAICESFLKIPHAKDAQ